MTNRRTILLLTVGILSGMLVTPAVRADEGAVNEAREHYKRGTNAFELGSYEEAIKEYAAAYRLRDDPALLYNLGQANRLGNHPAEALRFFRLFLIKVPATPNHAEVQAKIEELQKLVEQQKKTQNMPPDSVTPPGSTPAPTPPAPTQPNVSLPPPAAVVVAPEPETPESRAGRKKELIGAVVAGAGVLFVAGGIACGVVSHQAGDKLTQLDQSMQMFDYSQQQLGTTTQILEGVFIGVGAAAVVAGGALFFVGRSERSRARHVAVVPSAGRSSLGAVVEGSF